MSEIEAAGQAVREMASAVKEVIQESRKHLSNAEAEATGRHLEGEAGAEQRALESPESTTGAHDWYEPGDTQGGLPPEAQTDGPWPLGRPDLSDNPS
jgi:hypothetical protein